MSEPVILTAAGREVAISNPRRCCSRRPGYTKLDLARYYLAVAEGALRGAGGRPNVLVRYPDGVGGEFFYQKRAPKSRPAWVEVVSLQISVGSQRRGSGPARRGGAAVDGQPRLPRAASASRARGRPRPSGRAARRSRSGARRRVAADPRAWRCVVARRSTSSASSAGRRRRARAACTSTCASSRAGRFDRGAARRAGAGARGRAARAALATSKWWKEERHGVFLDYNQNAKDRTVAGAYSVRPTPDARVSAPLGWDEVADCDPRDFTLATMPARFAAARRSARGDRSARRVRSSALLELSARHEARGAGRRAVAAALRKQAGEPPRVAPSRNAASPSKHRCIEIGRAREARRTRSRASSAGRRRHPEAARISSRPTCWSTRCAAARDLDARARQPAARARGAAPAAGAARSRLRSGVGVARGTEAVMRAGRGARAGGEGERRPCFVPPRSSLLAPLAPRPRLSPPAFSALPQDGIPFGSGGWMALTRAVLAAGVAAAALSTACASAPPAQTAAHAPAQTPAATPSNTLHATPPGLGRYPYSDADVDFMSGMIPHHAQAVIMAGWAPRTARARTSPSSASASSSAQRDEIATDADVAARSRPAGARRDVDRASR